MSGARSTARGARGPAPAYLNRATAERWLRKDAAPLHAYVVAGSDAVARAELRIGLIQRFAPPDAAGLSRAEFDAATDPPVDLLDALRELPLFHACRVVLVRRAEKIGAGDRFPGLLELVSGLDEATLLVLEMEGKAADLAKFPVVAHCLERKAAAYCYAPRDDADAIRWVREHGERHGWMIAREAAERIVALVGIEPLELAAEIRKVAFATGGHVTLAAVQELLSQHREREVFDWVEAVCAGSRAAVRLVGSATNAGREGPAAVGAMASRLDQFEAVLSGQAGSIPPFLLSKIQAAATHWSSATVEEARSILLDLDLALKSTPAETHLARLELATLRLVELVR